MISQHFCCFCRSILVLGSYGFVWKPNVRTDPTLLYGAICLSTKSLRQNGSRERNAQVHHLPNFAIGHFMRLWIQSMAICKNDLSYSPFYIFTHQTQVDSTISPKEVPRCSWWWWLIKWCLSICNMYWTDLMQLKWYSMFQFLHEIV